jgi:hypothetical protein
MAFKIENNYNNEDLKSCITSKNDALRTTLVADYIYEEIVSLKDCFHGSY